MKKKNVLEILFSVIFTVLSLAFLIQLYLMDKLPILYFSIICLVVILMAGGLMFLQLSKKINKTNKTLGKVLIGILSILLILGNVYIYKMNHTIRNIINNDTKKIEVSVIVKKESAVEKIEDITGLVGNIQVGNSIYTDKAISEMKEINANLQFKNYLGFDTFGDDLLNGGVEAMILNEAMRGQFEETHPDFSEQTRVIHSFFYEEENKDISVNVDVTKKTFNVYISGIDQSGSIQTLGRSDVNKVMTINPQTRQIFILDIPRDYYIPQVCQANQLDKLTHTGIFGVDCTVESMSNYLGIDMNYYVRINFSSLEQIVDALGGVDVESAYDFNAGGYHFNVGINHLNGAQALAFSRERYSFEGGDNVRIANQTRVLKAIIDKVTSPAILTNYMSFMDAISGTFQTNMNEKEINALIKMQLNDMRSWQISSGHLEGTGGIDWTPANGFDAYVMYPDEDSRLRALKEIETIMNGGTLE